MISFSRPASWAFLARVCDRRANSSCSTLETPKAAARRSALWPIVSAVENSATAGSYTHTEGLQCVRLYGLWEKNSTRGTFNRSTHLWGEVRQPDTTNQTEPLAEGLGLVEGQHGLPHFTAVTDRNIRHELHPSCHHSITLASSNQTNSYTKRANTKKRQVLCWWKTCIFYMLCALL